MAKNNLNLTVLLKHLDLQNLELYGAFRQNEVERKELDRLLAYVLPLWVSGTETGRDQIALLTDFNRQVNVGWSELTDHPELRAKVLGSIGLRRVIRHNFYYRGTKPATSALKDLLTRRYPDLRNDEITLWCSVNSETNLLDLCARYGLQEKERDAVISDYRKVLS